MFDRVKQCNLSRKVMFGMNNFLYVFNLRQGTVLIAVHQIALSSIVLIVLLVGVSHVGEMLSMLHTDMIDDAERRGFYEVLHGEHMTFHENEPDVVSTNNQIRFARAQELAFVTVVFLYSSTVITSLYLMSSISLLYGAIKYKREFVMPWIVAAWGVFLFLAVGMVVGSRYPCVVEVFGGQRLYQFGSAVFLLSFVYAICAVKRFTDETGTFNRCVRDDERGEQILLIDHASNSSLLSAAQLTKLNNATRTQLV